MSVGREFNRGDSLAMTLECVGKRIVGLVGCGGHWSWRKGGGGGKWDWGRLLRKYGGDWSPLDAVQSRGKRLVSVCN